MATITNTTTIKATTTTSSSSFSKAMKLLIVLSIVYTICFSSTQFVKMKRMIRLISSSSSSSSSRSGGSDVVVVDDIVGMQQQKQQQQTQQQQTPPFVQQEQQVNHQEEEEQEEQDTPSSSSIIKNKIIPNSHKYGKSIIFFLHVPKTGGVGMRMNMANYQYKQGEEGEQQKQNNNLYFLSNYVRGVGKKGFANVVRTVEQRLSKATAEDSSSVASKEQEQRQQEKQDVLWVEVHTLTPGLLSEELHTYLTNWRIRSKEVGIPFFAFTMIREPISHSVSWYEDICIKRQNPKQNTIKSKVCRIKTSSSSSKSTNNVVVESEQHLIQTLRTNPQVTFLTGRWHGINRKERSNELPTRDELHVLWQERLLQHMEWIGVTQRYNETIYILERILGYDDDSGKLQNSWKKNYNTNHGTLHSSMLQPQTKESIINQTYLDNELHTLVQNTYTLQNVL